MPRPTKYKPEYCELLIKHMAEGLTFSSFAAIVKTNIDTLYEWAKVHPAFSDAKRDATAQLHLFWEKAGRGGTLGKIAGFNSSTWNIIMKNCCGWRDKQEVELTEKEINLKVEKDDTDL